MKVAAGQFKARCLQLMDEVEQQRKEITITKRGRSVAKLVPISDERSAEKVDPFGCMRGTVTIAGDIISPVDADWEADA